LGNSLNTYFPQRNLEAYWGIEMFRDREQIRQRLKEIIEKFKQKGATSPEKALTLQELGLPPRFEQAMHRRLGQSGIFVEVNGKYYLNEERLRQLQEQRANEGYSGSGGRESGSTADLVSVGWSFSYASHRRNRRAFVGLFCWFWRRRLLSR
jgi:hypothetical protein